MRVLADINISTEIADGLRRLGQDVTRVDVFLAPTASDAEIAALAVERHAAVLTRDQDFAALLAVSRGTAPSIINLRHSRTDSSFLIKVLELVLRNHQAALVAGSIITIDDGGVRVHALPIGSER